MLKQRIITALILLPIALGGFFLLEGASFALFIGLVVTLGAWEWARLAGFPAQSARVAYAAAVAAMLFIMYVVPGARALGAGRRSAVVGDGDLPGTDLSADYPSLGQCGDQAGDRPVDPAAGLAGADLDQARPAGQLANHGCDGAGVGCRRRRLLLRQGLRQAQAGAEGQPWQELGRGLWWPGLEPGDHDRGRLCAGLDRRAVADGALLAPP